MALTELTENLNIIQSLADKPALSSSELKATFDDAANKIKTYVNGTLIPELNTILASLSNKDTSLQSAINTINTTLTTAVANISSLQSTVSSHTSSISTLNTQMSTANSNISALQTVANGLKSGATTKISSGTSVPSSLSNGEVYLQYFN